jgi:hypothetical protein
MVMQGTKTVTLTLQTGSEPVLHPGSNPAPVVSATNVHGNTSATWNPLIQVSTPGAAVAGSYTATITHSVV